MKRKSRNRPLRPASSPSQTSAPPAPPPAPPASEEPVHIPAHLLGTVAKGMLSPEMTAAQSMHHMMEDCLTEAGIKPPVVAAMLKEQGQAAAEGDLAQVRRSLAAQAAMLEKMFHHLFTLAVAGGKHSQDLFERYLRLALKAQTQAMRTQHVLGRLCRETHRETKARQKEAEAKPRQPAAKSSPDQAPAKTAPPISPAPVNLHRRTAVMQSTERALRGGSVWQAGGREALHGLSAPRK